MTIWRMRISSWIPKATNTRTEYVILSAFLLQQFLHEHTSALSYTYNACPAFRSHIDCGALYIKP